MVDKVWSRQAGKRVIERIDKAFANISRTRYWITVVKYSPDNGYNIFFNIKRARIFTRSLPIAEYRDCSFENLIMILQEVRTKYQFTIDYRDFSQQERRMLYKEIR